MKNLTADGTKTAIAALANAPVKLSAAQVTDILQELHTDSITPENTRPAGPNDKKPPSEVICSAIEREVRKTIRGLEEKQDPKRIKDIRDVQRNLGARARHIIDQWNDYITFAFDPKQSTHEFYKKNELKIKAVVDYTQKGILKGQLDRQLIWRYRQTPKIPSPAGSNGHGGNGEAAETHMIAAPVAEDYQATALAHNASFMMGTIGQVLSQPNVHTDKDANEFTDIVIHNVKEKMELYDPVQVAFSTFMTKPIKWSVHRVLHGKAQDRFNGRMKHAMEGGFNEEGDRIIGVEAITPPDRSGADGIVFMEEDVRRTLMRRLREAGEKLMGDRARTVFSYKIEHPDTTLQETGEGCGCTRENVRQALGDIGRQMARIDPMLTHYVRAMIGHNAEDMDAESLQAQYEPNTLQLQVRELIDEVGRDLDGLRADIGVENIVEANGRLRISKAIRRGDKEMQEREVELEATHNALQLLQTIVDSPFVDAGFDVLSQRQLQALAFYPGGSQALEHFVDAHIEDIAIASRGKALAECKTQKGKLEKLKTLADRFYESTPDDLARFKKSEISALLAAPESSLGDIPDHDDLMIVRRMGIALARQSQLELY